MTDQPAADLQALRDQRAERAEEMAALTEAHGLAWMRTRRPALLRVHARLFAEWVDLDRVIATAEQDERAASGGQPRLTYPMTYAEQLVEIGTDAGVGRVQAKRAAMDATLAGMADDSDTLWVVERLPAMTARAYHALVYAALVHDV